MIGIFLFILSTLGGVVLCNSYFPTRSSLEKLAGGFLIGQYVSGTLVFVLTFIYSLLGISPNVVIWTVLILQFALIVTAILKRNNPLRIPLTLFELALIALLFVISYYLMYKSFSYQNGTFQIASNLYQDLGAHIPLIRSFSLGKNMPPAMPFFSEHPLTYHFLFDFLVGTYEKSGIPIAYAFNILSSLAMTATMVLVFALSQILFGHHKKIGIIAIAFCLTNSTTSFISAFRQYGFKLFDYYHHMVYLGNGPFGENTVSIFWNLNTYLNQRHFLFALGIGIYITLLFVQSTRSSLSFKSKLVLGSMIGFLPFWHSTVYIALLIILGSVVIQAGRKNWTSYAPLIIPAIILALPQFAFISQHTINSVKFSPGFLAPGSLVLWIYYWIHNLGASFITIPLGIYFAPKKSRILLFPLLLLFVVANLFQFSAQMFDNHKFFNMMIILANLYSAYLIVWLFDRTRKLKIIALVLVFFLTISGAIDFFVVKNDVKTTIPDYPDNQFMSWIINNTEPDAVFLTNGDIYDPVTIAGKKTVTGRTHYSFLYGIDATSDFVFRSTVLSGLEPADNIYIAIYTDQEIPVQQVEIDAERLRKLYATVYADNSVTVYHK